MFIQRKSISGVVVRPALATSGFIALPCQSRVRHGSSCNIVRSYHASVALYVPAGYPRRRINNRNNDDRKTKIQQSDIMKIVQNQHNISQTQSKILEIQRANHQTTLEVMKIQHNNYHTMMEITEKMEQIIHKIILTNEDVQVSDKIAFAAGFGCGLLVCLAIWISPFGGKDKDEDADK